MILVLGDDGYIGRGIGSRRVADEALERFAAKRKLEPFPMVKD